MSTAQVSVYGVGDGNLNAAVEAAITIVRSSGLPYTVGRTQTLIDADDDTVLFHTLRALYQAAAAQGEVVVVATISNACPLSVDGGG